MFHNRVGSIALALVSLSTIVGFASWTGCSDAADAGRVGARVNVIGRTASALSAASMDSLKGTYSAACGGHVGATDTWTITMDGTTAAGNELSVQKNDANCVLTITALVADGVTYEPAATIPLSTADTYATTAEPFNDDADAGATVDFYGNAKIDETDFDDDFTITLQVSDEPTSADAGAKAATFAVNEGSVSASEHPAPQYTVSYADFVVQKDTDNKVVGVSGVAALTDVGVDGQHYKVVLGAFDSNSDVADITAAFTSPVLLSSLTALEIPAAQFLATDGTIDLDDLTQRTIIIRNLDTATGVASYQLHLITFTP